MKRKTFLLLLFSGTIIWCFVFELFILKSFGGDFFNFFQNYETPAHLKNLFIRAPVLEERLFLIDRNMLKVFYELNLRNESLEQNCIFCKVKKNQPITFALLCPSNASLEVSILAK